MADSFRAAFDVPGVRKSLGSSPPLDRPECSPCHLKFTATAIDPHADDPYDSKRCDSECLGKWGAALRRFAGRALETVQSTFGTGDAVVRLRLLSAGREYTFQMSDNQGGFVWRGGSAQAAATYGQLSAELVIGASVGCDSSRAACRRPYR